jgi:hypothetical protein
MNVALSFLISFLAWIAIMINGLVVFRFKPLSFWKEIMLVSIFSASISYIIQFLNLIALITFVPPVLAILFFSLLTRIRLIYSLIMIAVGVTVSGFLEFGSALLFNQLDIQLALSMLSNDYTWKSSYFVGIHFVISFILFQKRLGFTTLNIHQSPRLRDKSFIFTLLFLTANSISGLFIVFKQSSILYLVILVFLAFIYFMINNYLKELNSK